ncbi:hypothetical protein CRG98_048456 [Punica granatum]|uniref:Uncharacterized protein n=1 Tax=Punica granatum TaxID=22663 RepID=A0A2I0HHI8_PUNGR|nr:hypothetical protein CRG98_048456 [Punica granatum]
MGFLQANVLNGDLLDEDDDEEESYRGKEQFFGVIGLPSNAFIGHWIAVYDRVYWRSLSKFDIPAYQHRE